MQLQVKKRKGKEEKDMSWAKVVGLEPLGCKKIKRKRKEKKGKEEGHLGQACWTVKLRQIKERQEERKDKVGLASWVSSEGNKKRKRKEKRKEKKRRDWAGLWA